MCFRPPEVAAPKKCPECGARNPGVFKTCKKCGNPLPEAKITCPECGKQMPDSHKVCSNCGFNGKPGSGDPTKRMEES
ncbi:double zinc ribbon protein [Desulfitobacterium sp. LBE]|uniref:zinc-ribbon domain-containing protein n=1 Tax=Desulfitobacterium TaxID=36853 RepID=UPI00039E0E2C|nr:MULTISPECIES: zinc-ribbon domain-containing protein [Desulfitobacterium]TWH59485.1 double zinc ribbon protein [Desulfitobacterium sp. LBE]